MTLISSTNQRNCTGNELIPVAFNADEIQAVQIHKIINPDRNLTPEVPMAYNMIEEPQAVQIDNIINPDQNLTPEDLVFKDTFFYPVELIKKRPTSNTPKIPSVMTSKEWLALEKARGDKQKCEQDQKVRRKLIRETKKLEMEQAKTNKKKERDAKKAELELIKITKKVKAAKAIKKITRGAQLEPEKINIKINGGEESVSAKANKRITRGAMLEPEKVDIKINGVKESVKTKANKRKLDGQEQIQNNIKGQIKKRCTKI